MTKLGIEFISVFGMPPVEFVNLTADLGCEYIGMGLAPMPWNPLNYPLWSLRDDAKLRREMNAAMRDRGVSISVAEGFMIAPQVEAKNFAADMDLMRELGCPRINAISIDFADKGRNFDQFGVMAELAKARGMACTVEFAPMMAIRDLATAVELVHHVGLPNFTVLIDTMHLARCGAGAKGLAAVGPKLIGYVQLCDCPAKFTMESYGDESRFERQPPGEGELPLLDYLKVLSPDLVVGLETPMQKESLASGDPRKPLTRCVKAARDLLKQRG